MMSVSCLADPYMLRSYESEDTAMMWGYGFSWGGMLVMMLGMTLLWVVLIVVLAWAAIRWLNKPTTTSIPPKTNSLESNMSAIEILRQRYARGEIDGATFEQMRERIEASEGRGYQQ